MTLHYKHRVQLHTSVPYLWRAFCNCGACFYAPDSLVAEQALTDHIAKEVPFPDLTDIVTPEPGSGADRVQKES